MSGERQPCWTGKDSKVAFVEGLPTKIGKFKTINALFDSMSCCTRCDLAAGRTQVVHGIGDPTARVMLIGEAPGEKEDLAGEPFVGAAGRLLNHMLEANGIKRDDVFITNIVACRPPKNRTPRVSEVRAHAPWIEEQIRLIEPKLIVTLGRVALTYFIPKAKVTELRGKPQRIEYGGSFVSLVPTLHPAAVLRDPELKPKLESDFAKIAAELRALSPVGSRSRSRK